MSLLSRFANIFRGDRLDRELDDELQFHVAARIDDLVAGGLSRADAERQARRRLGNRLRLRESSREAKLLPWLESVFKDVQFGLRMLWKQRLVTAAAVFSLALAIGATTAAFSLLDALLLRPLPVRDPDRLVLLEHHSAAGSSSIQSNFFSHPLYLDLSKAASAYADLFEVSLGGPMQIAVFDDSAGQEEKIRTEWLSGAAFDVLGVKPQLGRLLNAADDSRPAVVLSDSFWRRRFGASPAILGRSVAMNSVYYQVVGVAAKGFSGLEPGYMIDVWGPLERRADARTLADPYSAVAQIWGRLRPGVPAERAQEIIRAAFTNYLGEVKVRPGPDQPELSRGPLFLNNAARGGATLLRWQFTRPFWIAGVITVLVLLIAGSNLANLLLARAAARRHEMAMRMSIGASRTRLVRQVLIESGLLAFLACIPALAFASFFTPVVVSLLSPAGYPAYLNVSLDWRALSFLAVLGASITLLFGIAPALRASGVSPNEVLKSGEDRYSRKSGMLRPVLAAQMGFSFAILFVAGLLLLSFKKLESVDPGFAKDRILLLSVAQRQVSENGNSGVPMLQILDRVRSLPGVEAASMSSTALLGGAFSMMRIPMVRIPGLESKTARPNYLEVSPGFFSTMGVRLASGRDLGVRDADPASPAVLVNQAFVRRYFPDASPLGRRFERVGGEKDAVPQEIVGVVHDFKYNSIREAVTPTVYAPLRRPNGVLEVRAVADPLALVPILREELHRLNPGLRITDAALQSARIEDTLLGERLLALVATFFTVIAVVLAAVGLYGVLSYAVVQRTREVGIRMALGAGRPTIVQMLLSDVLWTTAIGVAAGFAGGLALARLISSLLFQVTPWDTSSVVLPLAVLAIACLLAALPPAMRAARIDPAVALRAE